MWKFWEWDSGPPLSEYRFRPYPPRFHVKQKLGGCWNGGIFTKRLLELNRLRGGALSLLMFWRVNQSKARASVTLLCLVSLSPYACLCCLGVVSLFARLLRACFALCCQAISGTILSGLMGFWFFLENSSYACFAYCFPYLSCHWVDRFCLLVFGFCLIFIFSGLVNLGKPKYNY